MLVLSRKQDQQVVIGDQIRITVLKIRGNSVRLGIEAPQDVPIVRGELQPFERQGEVTVEFKSNADSKVNPESLRVFPTSTAKQPTAQGDENEPTKTANLTRLQQIVAEITRPDNA